MARPSLPYELAQVDRTLKLWATGWDDYGLSGGTHPLETIRKMHEGATRSGPIPEPAELKQIEEIVNGAPVEVSAIVKVWYRNDLPVQVKADRLGIHRSTIYDRWKEALRYVQGGMKSRGVKCIS